MLGELTTPESKLDIFLCHAHEDKVIARDLYERLDAKGHNPWLDEKKILPGQEWKTEITKAIHRADVIIFCLSIKSVAKEGFVQVEVKEALEIAREKPEGTIYIIPLRLDSCDVPISIAKYQWVEYSDNGFERLLESLKQRSDDLKNKRTASQNLEINSREKTERKAHERAEREARERAEREARERAEREARERAEREARERAEREAREKVEREAREKVERERIEWEESVKKAREQSKIERRVGDISGFEIQSKIDIPPFSLQNPLTYQVDYIRIFLDQLKSLDTSNHAITSHLLSAIGTSLGAKNAFLVRENKGEYVILAQSSNPDINIERSPSLDTVFSQLLNMDKTKLLQSRYGLVTETSESSKAQTDSKQIFFIPVKFDSPREFIVIYSVPADNLKYGQVIGQTIISTYTASNEFTSFDSVKIESAILDTLKSLYGYVPINIYQQRYGVFLDQLKSMTQYFAPILKLGRYIEIDSWEALLRDPLTRRAPIDLYRAAELWGAKFSRELDIYNTKTAMMTYRTTWEKENLGQKMVPLNLNIYPDTLFSSSYIDELKFMIDEEIMSGANIILGISEKLPIARADTSKDYKAGIGEFTEQIKKINKDLNINFGVDDFGVGHSSVSRLTQLEIVQVKLDRELLFLESIEYTLRYILELVNKTHLSPIKVIVAGFDGESRISLSTLYNTLGIRYIQGYSFGNASPSLRGLSAELVSVTQGQLAQ